LNKRGLTTYPKELSLKRQPLL